MNISIDMFILKILEKKYFKIKDKIFKSEPLFRKFD